MRVVTVSDLIRGTVIGDRIKVANTSFSRMVGLLGKPGLNIGEGLWISPCSGVHTVGMRFTIDVIGLDKDLKVVKIWSRLDPFRVTSVSLKIRSVIELGAGRIDECMVEIGDTLRVTEVPVSQD
jgi:uncharacterized membrane protein (UPF0127 family)